VLPETLEVVGMLCSVTTLMGSDAVLSTVGEEERARQVVKVTKDFGDHYAEVSAFRVPESDRYPDGTKYSMQYGNAAGETIIRYDNFPDHPDASHHHKHLADGRVDDVEFNGL